MTEVIWFIYRIRLVYWMRDMGFSKKRLRALPHAWRATVDFRDSFDDGFSPMEAVRDEMGYWSEESQ